MTLPPDSKYETLTQLSNSIHAVALHHGFWEETSFAEKIALIHSELSEALEAYRSDPNAPDPHCPSFRNTEVELADAIIRILDLGVGCRLDIGGALLAKMEFNKTRPYKHNKQF